MPVETYEYSWKSVYDDTGVDYLFTKVSILCRALVNGQAQVVLGGSPNGPFMSYAREPGSSTDLSANPARDFRAMPGFTNRPNVNFTTGIDIGARSPLTGIVRVVNFPLLTHEAIRHRLTSPRGQLYVFSGPGMETNAPPAGSKLPPGGAGTLINLASPFPGYPCDSRNGPIPRLFNVAAAAGDATTLMVDWGCETYVNEATINGVNPAGAMLSNRFAQTHTVKNGFTTVRTEGLAVFRSDFVYGNDYTPDFSRPIIFMPIMPSFTREIDFVTAGEDGVSIRYGYTDTQQSVNFVAGPYVKAAKISAVHRQAVSSKGDLIGGALGAYERVLGIKANRNFARSESGDDSAKAMRKLARMIGREVRKAPKGDPGHGAVPPGGAP